MGISGITNLNMYAKIQAKQTSWQNKETSPVSIHTNADSTQKATDAVKNDIKPVKGDLSKPLTEEELQRRQEVRDALRDADPSQALGQSINPERMAQEKEKVAKYGPIQSKMLSGKPLTAEEKSFLREHYPEAFAMAARVEEEIKRFQDELKDTKSKADADKLYMQKKMQALSGPKGDSNISLLLAPALDEAYRSYKS